MTQSSPYRLPPNVRPTAYRLTLTPDLEDFTFTGHVSIDLQVSESTGRFLLNAAELEITSASVTDAYGGPMPASGILLDEKRERAFLTFPREIATGRATLSTRIFRHPQRPAKGLLSVPLHGRRRSRTQHGCHPIRSHRRPPRLSLLGRASRQSHLRANPPHSVGANRSI